MWTRLELKTKAKERFKANYWKAVLIGLVIAIVAGGATIEYKTGKNDLKKWVEQYESTESNSLIFESTQDLSNYIKDNMPQDETAVELNDAINELSKSVGDMNIVALVAYIVFFVLLATAFACAFGFAVRAFILNPIELGGRKFFYRNLTEKAELDLIVDGFKHEYLNGVKIMFLRDLYCFLWSLLFIIPGIVKSYEYRMVKYILADNPAISKDDAFALSKEMMTGNKWDVFVLDLSFILWHIASACTAGIVGVFYVNPYVAQTDAALYEALKGTGSSNTEYEHYVEVE